MVGKVICKINYQIIRIIRASNPQSELFLLSALGLPSGRFNPLQFQIQSRHQPTFPLSNQPLNTLYRLKTRHFAANLFCRQNDLVTCPVLLAPRYSPHIPNPDFNFVGAIPNLARKLFEK
jgi:hypothetical protein